MLELLFFGFGYVVARTAHESLAKTVDQVKTGIKKALKKFVD